jgi:transposase-like protein
MSASFPSVYSVTLLPIIKNEVELGSIIHSDEWRAYSSLNNEGYIHNTVNHQKWFIDLETNANTQTIECLWKIVKKRYEIRVNGASPLLHRQLKEEWWRSLHPNKETIFDEFLSDMKDAFIT